MLRSGEHEPLKAGAHATMGVLAAVFVGYNGAAWLLRHERHLAVNVVLYTALLALEIHNTSQHLEP